MFNSERENLNLRASVLVSIEDLFCFKFRKKKLKINFNKNNTLFLIRKYFLYRFKDTENFSTFH